MKTKMTFDELFDRVAEEFAKGPATAADVAARIGHGVTADQVSRVMTMDNAVPDAREKLRMRVRWEFDENRDATAEQVAAKIGEPVAVVTDAMWEWHFDGRDSGSIADELRNRRSSLREFEAECERRFGGKIKPDPKAHLAFLAKLRQDARAAREHLSAACDRLASYESRISAKATAFHLTSEWFASVRQQIDTLDRVLESSEQTVQAARAGAE
jgi:hypothetical protein